MNWVIWQQHKRQFLVLGLVLAAFAAFIIPTGIHYWHVYQQALAACATAECNAKLANELFLRGMDANIFDAIKFVIVAVPALLGIFFGLSLVGREYTEGTNLLAWTQGVSRRKWLTAKIGWTLAATAAAAGIVAALHTWWWRTGNSLHLSRFQPLDFVVQGIVPIAITVFAVAVAIAFGAWFKRILPALGVLLVVVITAQSCVPMLARPHYQKAIRFTSPLLVVADKENRADEAPTPPASGAAWITDSAIVDRQGKPLDWLNPPHDCSHTVDEIERTMRESGPDPNRAPEALIGREGGPVISFSCLNEKGYHWDVRYQTADRYWKFQIIESALYLLLSVPFIAFTYYLVLRRDA